jgi:hypothetical protein
MLEDKTLNKYLKIKYSRKYLGMTETTQEIEKYTSLQPGNQCTAYFLAES